MLSISKKYIKGSNEKPIAVQVDIDTFNKMEEIIEDYALGKLMDENDDNDLISLNDAEEEYRRIKKE